MTLVVAAFYQFADVPDPAALRAILLPQAEALGLKGTLILAREGINGTLAGAAAAMDRFLALLTERFDALELKRAETPIMPFKRLKLRIKREIVTLAAPEADPVARVGVYVTPLEWNALLDDPEVTLIDTRNSFEVAHGSFPGSIDPGTVRFGEFPRFVDTVLNPERHRKVAMFCTGGIRCEKATSLLLARGFAEVYHLKGGILGYLAQMPAAENGSRANASSSMSARRLALAALAGGIRHRPSLISENGNRAKLHHRRDDVCGLRVAG